MGFKIEIKTSCIEIDAFHFYPQWEEGASSDEEIVFLNRCLTVSPSDSNVLENIVAVIRDRDLLTCQCLGKLWANGV